jgi:hypothetical protein
MTIESRSRAAMLAELALRERELKLYGEGKLTMTDDGEPITADMVRQWCEEILKLRTLTTDN